MTVEQLINNLLKIENKLQNVTIYQHCNGGYANIFAVKELPKDVVDKHCLSSSEYNDKDTMITLK